MLGLALLVPPHAADAQPVTRVPKVAFVFLSAPDCKLTPQAEGFPRGLRDLGYVPGRDFVLDMRCYATNDELRRILDELVRLKVDVIAVGVPAQAHAAKKATTEIPIVCASCGDPVSNGLVTNLGRPGGNVTGLASLSAELIGKRVQLLKVMLPGMTRMAAVLYPDNPGTALTVGALDIAGRNLGIEIQRLEVRNAGDFAKAFQTAAARSAGAVLIQDDPLSAAARVQIGELALKHRLPASVGVPENVVPGIVMAYGPDRTDLYRRAAGFVDRILKGAKPGDLPFEQPTKYELVINMKTAKTLGLTIAPALLLQTDRTIE